MATLPALAAGALGGIALAVALSPLLPLGVTRRTDPDVGVHADALVLVPGSVGAVAVMMVALGLAARRWGSRARGDVTAASPSLTARVATEVGLGPVAATGADFALARVPRRTRVLALPTVIVLAAVVAVVAGALVVRWSLDGLVADRDRFGQPYDLRVSLAQEEDLDAAARRLAADPRVRDVAVTRQGEVDVVGGRGAAVQVHTTGVGSVTGPVPVTVLHGRTPAGPREIAFASSTMEAVGLEVGDRTTVSGPCGQFEMDVVGRVIVPLTGSDFPDAGSILTLGAFAELCADGLVNSIDVNERALVRFNDVRTVDAVRREWEAAGLRSEEPQIPNSIGLISELRAVPVIVAVIVGALGTAAAAHALFGTVRRRRRDLAVLRALGFRPGQAGRIVRWQAITLAAVALAVGVPAGLVLGRLVWAAIAGPSNVLVRVDLSVLGLVVLAGAVTVVAAVVAIGPSHRASRLRPAATLRSE
jgi:hypothetical protein